MTEDSDELTPEQIKIMQEAMHCLVKLGPTITFIFMLEVIDKIKKVMPAEIQNLMAAEMYNRMSTYKAQEGNNVTH